MLALLITLFAFVSLSGLDCPLNFYGPSIFADFGFSHPRLAACVIPAGQFAGYCIAPPLMTVIAKRWQYLVSALLMAFASGILSITFHFRTGPAESLQSMNSTDLTKGMPSLDLLEEELPSVGLQTSLLLSCFLFTLSYGAGMGAVTYAMPGELLGPQDKILGSSLPQCLRMLATAALLKVYPTLLTLSGLPVLLLLHSTLLLAAAFFVIRFLPETKNRSLTEIHQHFSSTKVAPTLSSEHNLPRLATHVSETVKEAMIDTVQREKKERGEEVELDCESVGSRLEGVRRRSTMVNPAVQPKLQNYV